ncbi:class II glutamine amidotransferase [Bradyrhizobium canariense]|uniref:N-methylglutamate synthase subunit A n=1 Tax=Bradyrhizobium canariense TaxID=255045 RepID=A0A1H1NFU5_9BRAD|nr:glutamine amidotransferase family protein [Bradyrhizobium canariense]SDR97856.1 N-methylglutamate synthase subunit A [Bradyrhizobium canariense]
MCGIVGLFIKDESLEPNLGEMLSGMLGTMCDRGPDSAGFAVYGSPENGVVKVTLQSADPAQFNSLQTKLSKILGRSVAVTSKDTHAILRVDHDIFDTTREVLRDQFPQFRVMAVGERIEIYKEVGYPTDVAGRFGLANMRGTHGIGHTRMATESAVTSIGAHPFSTGSDQCLVHNGSLSNHNNLRRELKHEGRTFETENDTEVAAAYLSAQMDKGLSLGASLEKSLGDLDGFYTFVVGTRDGFGVLRDPVACKPAVLAETDRYVAFGSEYRALVGLPDIESARVWEPEPATVYFWGR